MLERRIVKEKLKAHRLLLISWSLNRRLCRSDKINLVVVPWDCNFSGERQ